MVLRPSCGTYKTTVREAMNAKVRMFPYIMPRHTGLFKGGNLVANIVVNMIEICEASIIVVLAREECLIELCWMRIGKRAANRE